MKLWNCVKLRAYTHALNGYERKEGKCTDTTWWRVWRTLSSRMCVIQIWIVFKRDYFFCKIIFKKLQLIIFSLFSSVLLWFFLHAKHKCSSKLYVIIHLILLVLYNALLKRHQGKSLSINRVRFYQNSRPENNLFILFVRYCIFYRTFIFLVGQLFLSSKWLSFSVGHFDLWKANFIGQQLPCSCLSGMSVAAACLAYPLSLTCFFTLEIL